MSMEELNARIRGEWPPPPSSLVEELAVEETVIEATVEAAVEPKQGPLKLSKLPASFRNLTSKI